MRIPLYSVDLFCGIQGYAKNHYNVHAAGSINIGTVAIVRLHKNKLPYAHLC